MGEMYEFAVRAVLAAAAVYASAGAIFALFFAAKGVRQIDDTAKGSGIGFRLIIIPGAIAFWPLLARKWMTRPSRSRRA